MVSNAATVTTENGGKEYGEVMTNDVSRAYFYAPARRALFVTIPTEDPEGKEGDVGRLNVCLYGTRDAAKGWQEELASHLKSLGVYKVEGTQVFSTMPNVGL